MATDTPFERMTCADRVWLSERRKRVLRLIGSISHDIRSKKILDVGMGKWSLIKNLFPDFYVVGIDRVSPMLPPDEFYLADISKGLPFKDSTFAMAFTGEVIEHLGLKSARYLIKEVFRVLQTGGYLLLTTPNGSRNKLKRILMRSTVAVHLRELSFAEITGFLTETGFRVLHSEGIQPSSFHGAGQQSLPH